MSATTSLEETIIKMAGLQAIADAGPCACEKQRIPATPQTPVSEPVLHDADSQAADPRYTCVSCTQRFRCGVCKEEHKLGTIVCVPRELVEDHERHGK